MHEDRVKGEGVNWSHPDQTNIHERVDVKGDGGNNYSNNRA